MLKNTYFETVKDDIFVSLGAPYSDLLIHCVLKLDSFVDIEILNNSYHKLLSSEPILSCNFITSEEKRPYWSKRTDDEVNNNFEIIERANNIVLDDLMKTPLDVENDGVFRMFVIRKKERDEICLKVSHIVSDAAGVKDIIYRLVSIYNNLKHDPEYKIEPIYSNRNLNQVYQAYGLFKKTKFLIYGLKVFLKNNFPHKDWSVPLVSSNSNNRKIIYKKINSKRFKAIKECCRKYSLTINDVVVASIYRALYKIIRPLEKTPLRMMSTVNLRRYIEEQEHESICNLSSLFVVNIGSGLGDDIKSTAIKVNHSISWSKSNDFGLESQLINVLDIKTMPYKFVLWLYGKINKIKLFLSTKKPLPIFTNMGVIDEARVAFDGLSTKDAFLTAPIPFFPLFYVGVTGYKNELTISSGFCDGVIDESKVHEILDDVLNELKEFSKLNVSEFHE